VYGIEYGINQVLKAECIKAECIKY